VFLCMFVRERAYVCVMCASVFLCIFVRERVCVRECA